MKRILITFLCIAMLISATACGSKPQSVSTNSSSKTASLLPTDGWENLPQSDSSDSSSSSVSSVTSSNTSSKNVASSSKSSTSSVRSSSTSSLASSSVAPPTPGTLQLNYKPKYSKGFNIEFYYGGARIIDTHIEKTANTAAVSQRVLILPNGAAEPKNTTWQHKISGYAANVVTLASSHAGHFGNLSAIDSVKGTSIKVDSCFIPSLKTALQNGNTKYVGSGSTADKELITSLNPQVVFVGGMQSDVDLAQKLEESGIYCFYFGDFAEPDYMARAQWIELIGAFIGKEQQGQDFMKTNESQINSIITRASSIASKPKVLWFTHSSSVPHFNIRTDKDYVNSIVSAVGGQLYFPPESTENSISLSNEDFLGYMMGAQKIIFGVSLNSYKTAKDITYFNKTGQIEFEKSPAFINDECYVVGYDWAQDTADALSIIKSMAICLYPDEFKDLANTGKIMKFKVS